jgi:diguanylate cyclase (GGDEF)-like protein
VGVFLRIEADMLIFAFGLVMLISIRLRSGKLSYEKNGIMLMISLVMILLALDASAWATSMWSGIVPIIVRDIILFVYYFLNNLVPVLWALFVYMQVHRGKIKLRHPIINLLPFMLSMGLLVANPFTNCLYLIDARNVYHRGSLFFLNVALCYIYLLLAIVIPFFNRRRLKRKQLVSLMLFGLPPLAGSVIQFASVVSLNLIWAGATLSILIIYLGMMNEKMNLDYLTGLYNRMQADTYVATKIGKSTPEHTFAGIMIDIDKFKEINDKYGHNAGDEALEVTAKLLKKSIGKKDFLARVGGDEFLIILDADDRESVKSAVEAIDLEFESYNLITHRPFTLKLSMGYEVYNYDLNMTRQQFLRHIDRLMYRKKRERRYSGELTASAGGSR